MIRNARGKVGRTGKLRTNEVVLKKFLRKSGGVEWVAQVAAAKPAATCGTSGGIRLCHLPEG